METLRGKKVTVMGLGLHGGALGTIEWLYSLGADITVTDMKTQTQLAPTLEKLRPYPNIRYVLGQHNETDFMGADMVIRNPSVPRTSPFLLKARENNVPVEMDSSLFFEYAPTEDIIGVTGSKGKTTTANAIAIVLKHFRPEAVAVGVDGVSPLGKLPEINKGAPAVFELSSWRLEALRERALSPKTAVVTSIYRDHLNTYDSFADYIEVKKSILLSQGKEDVAILNGDDVEIVTWRTQVPGRLYWYSVTDLPTGDGIFLRDGQVIIRQADKETVVMGADMLPLQSAHEKRNLLPAILIGYLRGMQPDELTKAMALVHRLPHRMEIVGGFDGVTYINDSAATMPDATIAALQSLQGKSVVHILGGSDKALEFGELAVALGKATIRALVWLPGTATEKMKGLILSQVPGVPTYDAVSMESAVALAKQATKAGDIVLMSPGATSFGLFLHEFDRGDKFRVAVRNLKQNYT